MCGAWSVRKVRIFPPGACTRCSVTPSTQLLSDTGARRGRPPRARAAAVSVYTAIYRRRWGCETALQGARLRLSRAYLAAGGDARHARGVARPTFDPGDADHFAAAASPVLRGLPAGQRD